jgi:chromatin segregation and condensation protein Rec8/ScpA/Scc1 (kleisin family)
MHKSEIIATFLAMLELIKNKKIKVFQEKTFDDIEISLYKE